MGGDFSRWGRDDKFFAGSERTPHHLPVGKILISTVVWNLFQGNLYTMFVILNIKFRVAIIKWNLCQNTVKFQNMTSLVDKICTNIQTSTGYYLLNWVLASVCSRSQKSWILFTMSTGRAVLHTFQNLIWTAMTLLFTATRFLFVCMEGMILFDAIKIEP